MTTRSLAWGINWLLGLAIAGCSLMTVAPEAQFGLLVTQAVLAAGFLAFGILGFAAGALPSQHWLNRSRPFKGVLLSILIVFGLAFLVLVVG